MVHHSLNTNSQSSPPARSQSNNDTITGHNAQYRLERLKLGEGALSEVRLGTNLQTGSEVAIKLVKKSNLLEIEKGHVKQEIEVLSRIEHHNIVKLLDSAEDKEYIYIVMEKLPCDLLEYLMSHGKFEDVEAKKIFRQLLDAVRYLHSRKIAQRDLKLENILIDDYFHIKLIDFGLCAIIDNSNLFTFHCGTKSYASPEIIKEKPYCGISNDIWCLGIILYALLTGGFPFQDERHTLEGKLRFPRCVSTQAKDLIARMLNRNVNSRISLIEILEHPWLSSDTITNL